MTYQESLTIQTKARSAEDITGKVASIVSQSQVITGLAHVFLHHTSASLMLCENADPVVVQDLNTFMAHLVPDGHTMFKHSAEGPDDMPAHVRTVLTHSDLTIPIASGQLSLGTWQGIYLWEHRTTDHLRKVTVTIR